MHLEKDPKYNMSEFNLNGQNRHNTVSATGQVRNFSAVHSQKTAASSNHMFGMTNMGMIQQPSSYLNQQYS